MLALRYVDKNGNEQGFKNESRFEKFTEKWNNAAITH